MSIRMRLIILSLMAFLSLGLLTGLGYIGNDRLKNSIHHNNELAELRELVSLDNALLNIHNQYLLTLQHNPQNPQIVKMHDHPETMHFNQISQFDKTLMDRIKAFNAHPAAQPFIQQSKDFQQKIEVYRKSVEGGLTLFRAVEYEQANLHLLQQMNPQLNQALQSTQDFRAVLSELAQQAKQDADAFANSQTNLMFFIGIAFLLLIGAVSWFTISSIRKGINETVNAVSSVVNSMKFDTVLRSRNDELNQISSALNQMLASLQLSIKETNGVVGAIAKGDFDQRVTSELKGDLATLKQGVNGSAESVKFMMDELAKVMQALHDGKFDVKMDSRVPKTFSAQVETALQTINNVIVDINNVMQAMSRGEFEQRVGANANGQLDIMKQNINSSMASLESAINDITRVVVAQSEGDLTQSIANQYAGQLGIVKDAINKSTASLDEIVSVAIEAANSVATGASEVAQGAMDLSQRVQEQAAAVEQSSATMEEFSAAVQNNAANSNEESKVEHQVEQKAQQAADVMKQTIVAMSAIQESSHKISEIVSLIDGIAFQTNLLALNAAVEAARAGDHGRGFAVVAGEVRALAQKSAEAAKDIKTLINESVTRIDQGTQLATESGEAINDIAASIEYVSQMSEQISQASSEQAEGVRQLQTAITQIDQVTQQNAALVEETSAAAESMREQAGVLSERMSFFKTTKGNSSGIQARTNKTAQLAAPIKPKAAALSAPVKANNTVKMTESNVASNSADEWSEF